MKIEVVNLWVDAVSLAGPVTLSNYDRPNNDNVAVPFASGCQSIWTSPIKILTRKNQKASGYEKLSAFGCRFYLSNSETVCRNDREYIRKFSGAQQSEKSDRKIVGILERMLKEVV